MDMTYSELLWASLFLLLIILLWHYYNDGARIRELINKLPGPPAWPLIGNALELYVDHAVFFELMAACTFCHTRCRLYRLWLGLKPYLVVFHPENVEAILSSNSHIEKSSDYNFLHPWLGTGLLTSKGAKWRSRRKLLTPSFHFRILEDFISVFNEQAEVLVNKLRIEAKKPSFDIFPLMTLCTLDIICDAVMGRHVNAQGCDNSPYVKATERIKEIIHSRQMRITLWPDWIFCFTKSGKEHAQCLQILHSFTNQVIQEKKAEWQYRRKVNSDFHDPLLGCRTRLAFLDLLIQAADGGRNLSDLDIREEVDTFMFEGHDTTAAAISWALYLLGSHPHIQRKVHEEIDSIFGDDFTKRIRSEDLKEVKYLECVIKESLRLFPSVPIFARYLQEDVVIDGYTIPAGVTAIVLAYMLHRDPTIFPDPEMFDPDRFLKKNIQERNPYAYIPFSAGPRNCIGQKFALMEEKVVLIHILRSFAVESIQTLEEIEVTAELIIRPRNGIKLHLKPREMTCSTVIN
uniref:Cytochrome P450 n=1 Tax=Strigamia maritima TaxID=126957 RepID=T1JES0_STRMM